MMKRAVGAVVFVFAIVLTSVAAPARAQDTITIKMASLLPAGSEAHNILLQMGEDWKKASGGKVILRIYPGQTMGDDPDVVRKMNLGSIQAALIASVGNIDPSIYSMQVPMMYSSYDEIDYVLTKMTPRLNAAMDAKGLVVLNWTDAGWVHFFTKTPVTHPEELKKQKLFAWAGDSDVIEMYRAAGLSPVPLPSTEIATALQTGLVTGMPAPTEAASLLQWYTYAKNMTDVKWAIMLGATVMSKQAWAKIPPDLKPALLAAAQNAGKKMRELTRGSEAKNVEAMRKRGLNVVHLDATAEAEWRRFASSAYPQIRGRVIPPAAFDEASQFLAEYRKTHGK